MQPEERADSVIKIKPKTYAWELALFLAGIGLNLYSAGEVLTAVLLSSVAILALGLALTSLFVIWHTGKNVVGWARAASRTSGPPTLPAAELVAKPRTTQ